MSRSCQRDYCPRLLMPAGEFFPRGSCALRRRATVPRDQGNVGTRPKQPPSTLRQAREGNRIAVSFGSFLLSCRPISFSHVASFGLIHLLLASPSPFVLWELLFFFFRSPIWRSSLVSLSLSSAFLSTIAPSREDLSPISLSLVRAGSADNRDNRDNRDTLSPCRFGTSIGLYDDGVSKNTRLARRDEGATFSSRPSIRVSRASFFSRDSNVAS